jgi:hypothetical protein
VEAVVALRAAGVEALLGKGWAAARHYAQPALRPYGDLDLFVPPAERARGLLALKQLARPLPVDLHAGFAELRDRGGPELFARAVTALVHGVEVRLFGAEDQLRLLVLHLLRHGASRPLWLCDVGALVEAEGSRLDWDLVLRGPDRLARAVAGVVGLAVRLLGARASTPDVLRSAGLDSPPRWLESALLEQWGRGSGFRDALADQLFEPRQLVRSLFTRWPNALEATAGVGAPFDDSPRWPYQAAFAAVRAFRFVRHLRGARDR